MTADQFRFRLSGLTGKIRFIALQQRFRIVVQNIDFRAKLTGFFGFQAADARIIVEAHGDTLEQFLGLIAGGGEEPFIVGRECADEVVCGFDGADRARVHIFYWNSFRNVNLPAPVDRLFSAGEFGEQLEAVFCEDKRFLDVIGLLRAGKTRETNAGLKPLHIDEFGTFVADGILEIDFVRFCGNDVIDNDGRLNFGAEAKSMRRGFKQLCFVGNGGLVPFAVSGTAAAERLEVPYFNIFARNLGTADAKHVVGPTEIKWLLGEDRTGGKECNQQGSHKSKPISGPEIMHPWSWDSAVGPLYHQSRSKVGIAFVASITTNRQQNICLSATAVLALGDSTRTETPKFATAA